MGSHKILNRVGCPTKGVLIGSHKMLFILHDIAFCECKISHQRILQGFHKILCIWYKIGFSWLDHQPRILQHDYCMNSMLQIRRGKMDN